MKDNTRPPEISTKAIFLLESNCMRYPEKPIVISPKVVMEYESKINGKVAQGILTLIVTCTSKETENKVFEARIRYVGVFEADVDDPNMPLEDFIVVNAPAQIFPYAREYLSNLSMRSNIQPIILPPFNIAAFTKGTLEGEIRNNNPEQN